MWTHVGRLWSDGEIYLALDAPHLASWAGFSHDHYEPLCDLGQNVTSTPVGEGSAGLIAPDGAVNDESWLEVFRDQQHIRIVQASGEDYRAVLQAALEHPLDDDDESGGAFSVYTGELVLYNAAMDGTGEHSGPIIDSAPGPFPTLKPHPVTGDEAAHAPAGLRLPVAAATVFQVTARWYTEVDGGCFARWLLTPQEAAQRR